MVDFPPGFQPEHESPTASLSLLESMRKREQSAWSRFHSLYCPSIYVYCQRAGIDAASADDVCQEVLTAVTRGLPGFAKRSSIDSFRGWLYRIAANNIIDFFRKARTEVHGRGGEA
ncbi:MAG: RNA polymerase sigma factor, partial [Planctomycetaceae bacterium]|nr:RNA polymerase sigma factor [Planctomycetaceae bacterium]